jgi:hypothetical protein
MGKEIARVYIGVCSLRSPKWKFVISIQRAIAEAAQKGITTMLVPHLGDSLISRARNDAMADFLQEDDYEYLLTLDDDINVPRDAIVNLVDRGQDIVSGFYRLKSDEGLLAIRTMTGQKPEIKYYRDLINEGGAVQVRYASTGCLMVHRKVCEKMIQENPDLKYKQNLTGRKQYALYNPMIYKGEYLSEDWAFCQRARDAGFQVWVDGRVLCGHVGEAEFVIKGV